MSSNDIITREDTGNNEKNHNTYFLFKTLDLVPEQLYKDESMCFILCVSFSK